MPPVPMPCSPPPRTDVHYHADPVTSVSCRCCAQTRYHHPAAALLRRPCTAASSLLCLCHSTDAQTSKLLVSHSTAVSPCLAVQKVQ
ncbi:hypothetical protein NL676_033643 [Syzygium grande]|nr:hypothetical protein NL676_033643 [Syzygium grande]